MFEKLWKLVLDEGLETLTQRQFGEQCVACLFKAEIQLFFKTRGCHRARLPVGAFDTPGVKQDDVFDTNARRGRECATEHRWARQRKNQNDGERWRRWLPEIHCDYEFLFRYLENSCRADGTVQTSGDKCVAYGLLQDSVHVSAASPMDAGAVFAIKVVIPKQQQVHSQLTNIRLAS